jgi:hypothetical protein
MPRRLILHIGTMKTGSTTIQFLLRHNRAALLERGICYPASPGTHNHQMLAIMFSSLKGLHESYDDRIWGGRDPTAVLAEIRANFIAEITALPAHVKTVIVSTERFSQLVREPEDLRQLRAMLAGLFDDITILIYLRRQDGHFGSNYSQTLRKGIVRRPSMARWSEDGGTVYDYDKLLAPWAEVFGQHAIKPRVFERDTDKTWDVVADFIAATGTGPLPAPPDLPSFRNPSMNLSGQRLLREIGRILKGNDETRAFARTALWQRLTEAATAALPGQGWRPTQDEARDFMENFAASNERVRALWLPQRARLFSDDFSHLPAEKPKPKSAEDHRAAYDVLLYVLRQQMAREHELAKRKAGLLDAPDAEAPAAPGEGTPKQRARRRKSLMRALRANKTDTQTRLELAALQMDEGATAAARHNVAWVLKRAPDHPRALELKTVLDAAAPEASAPAA